jgi:hypothetical protein
MGELGGPELHCWDSDAPNKATHANNNELPETMSAERHRGHVTSPTTAYELVSQIRSADNWCSLSINGQRVTNRPDLSYDQAPTVPHIECWQVDAPGHNSSAWDLCPIERVLITCRLKCHTR